MVEKTFYSKTKKVLFASWLDFVNDLELKPLLLAQFLQSSFDLECLVVVLYCCTKCAWLLISSRTFSCFVSSRKRHESFKTHADLSSDPNDKLRIWGTLGPEAWSKSLVVSQDFWPRWTKKPVGISGYRCIKVCINKYVYRQKNRGYSALVRPEAHSLFHLFNYCKYSGQTC